ncbi:MAG: hypothetical protein U0326_23485 [Polyangiales bacterium]
MHSNDPSQPGEGTLHTQQVNPGWGWYRIDQNGIPVALVEAQKGTVVTETWYYGQNYLEPSIDQPKGVALTFVPVMKTDFDALKIKIKVTRAFKHTLQQIL